MRIPDVPRARAVRGAGWSSLVGFLAGGGLVLVMDTLGWGEDLGFVAVLAMSGLGPVRRGYRLRLAVTAFAIGFPCAMLGHFLVGGVVPPPWDVFLPLAVAVAIGQQVGVAAVYRKCDRAAAVTESPRR